MEVEEILKALGQEFKAESEVRGMTREEAEQAISEKVAELWEIYKEYNPKGYSLSLAVTDNLIIVNNEYWKDDINNPLTKIIERKGANTWTDQATKKGYRAGYKAGVKSLSETEQYKKGYNDALVFINGITAAKLLQQEREARKNGV